MEASHGVDWWLRAAQRDQAVAEKLMRIGFDEGVGQHLSQAAQKYLKAVLAGQGRKTRAKSCAELLEEIAEVTAVPEDLEAAAQVLDNPPQKKKIKSLDDFPTRVDDKDAIANLTAQLDIVKAFATEALGRH